MIYFILSQGVNNENSSFIVRNGMLLDKDSSDRLEVLELFDSVRTKGKMIVGEDSSSHIVKYKEYFLIGMLTSNMDKVNRKVPVDILIKDYNTETFNEVQLNSIEKLLVKEDININQVELKLLLEKLNEKIGNSFQSKMYYLAVLSIVIAILVYYISK